VADDMEEDGDEAGEQEEDWAVADELEEDGAVAMADELEEDGAAAGQLGGMVPSGQASSRRCCDLAASSSAARRRSRRRSAPYLAWAPRRRTSRGIANIRWRPWRAARGPTSGPAFGEHEWASSGPL